MTSQTNIVDLGILFLLAMVVVGMAAKAATEGQQDYGIGVAISSFAIMIVGWVIITAITLVGIGALLWGGLWVWGHFSG